MRELWFSVTLDDCRVDTFTVGGHGGAGKDTSNTGVRVTHLASKAVGTSTESRQQSRNKLTAFRRMAETQEFRRWHRDECERRRTGKTIEDIVNEQLQPQHLKVEGRGADGQWETL